MFPFFVRRAMLRGAFVASAFAACGAPLIVQADTVRGYPSQPVTLVVPYAPGGATDSLARIVGVKLGQRLGQPVVIDNRQGASGQIGTEYVGRAKGDPYKLVIGTQAVFSVLPTLNRRSDFNVETGFTPITRLIQMPSVVLVPAASGIRSFPELVARLKAGKPEQYSYSSNGVGTAQHLMLAELLGRIGVAAVHVPYQGSTQALSALAGGDQIIVSVDNIPSAQPFIQSGKVIPLAVTTAQRAASLPDVPTISETGTAGLSDFDRSTWLGLMAPPGIDADVQQFLNREVLQVLADPGVRTSLQNLGFVIKGSSTQDFRTFVTAEAASTRQLLLKLNAAAE